MNITANTAANITALKYHHRRREDFIRARTALTNQAKAIVRGLSRCDDCSYKLCAPCQKRAQEMWKQLEAESFESPALLTAFGPFLASIGLMTSAIQAEERHMKQLVKELPVYAWAEGIKGLGTVSLGQLIGEAGDLSNFANPAKLWKWFGVHAGAERRTRGQQLGHSPQRRSILWRIGDSACVKAKGPYRAIYDARKARELEKAHEEGLTVVPAAKIPKGKQDEYRSEGHVHLRAKRYAEKRLLTDLWKAWKQAHRSEA